MLMSAKITTLEGTSFLQDFAVSGAFWALAGSLRPRDMRLKYPVLGDVKVQIILWNRYQVLYENPDAGHSELPASQEFYAVPPEIDVSNNVRNPEVWPCPKMIDAKCNELQVHEECLLDVFNRHGRKPYGEVPFYHSTGLHCHNGCAAHKPLIALSCLPD